jgi:hypothetical protein
MRLRGQPLAHPACLIDWKAKGLCDGRMITAIAVGSLSNRSRTLQALETTLFGTLQEQFDEVLDVYSDEQLDHGRLPHPSDTASTRGNSYLESKKSIREIAQPLSKSDCTEKQDYPSVVYYRQSWKHYRAKNCADNGTVPIGGGALTLLGVYFSQKRQFPSPDATQQKQVENASASQDERVRR